MDARIARQFVISRLSFEQYDELHRIENSIDRILVPYEIHTRFNTERWGDIPLEDQEKSGRRVLGIYHKILSEKVELAKKTGEYDEVGLYHEMDDTVKAQNIGFNTSKGDIHEKVEAAKKARAEKLGAI